MDDQKKREIMAKKFEKFCDEEEIPRKQAATVVLFFVNFGMGSGLTPEAAIKIFATTAVWAKENSPKGTIPDIDIKALVERATVSLRDDEDDAPTTNPDAN